MTLEREIIALSGTVQKLLDTVSAETKSLSDEVKGLRSELGFDFVISSGSSDPELRTFAGVQTKIARIRRGQGVRYYNVLVDSYDDALPITLRESKVSYAFAWREPIDLVPSSTAFGVDGDDIKLEGLRVAYSQSGPENFAVSIRTGSRGVYIKDAIVLNGEPSQLDSDEASEGFVTSKITASTRGIVEAIAGINQTLSGFVTGQSFDIKASSFEAFTISDTETIQNSREITAANVSKAVLTSTILSTTLQIALTLPDTTWEPSQFTSVPLRVIGFSLDSGQDIPSLRGRQYGIAIASVNFIMYVKRKDQGSGATIRKVLITESVELRLEITKKVSETGFSLTVLCEAVDSLNRRISASYNSTAENYVIDIKSLDVTIFSAFINE
jgi:hypothetical protein